MLYLLEFLSASVEGVTLFYESMTPCAPTSVVYEVLCFILSSAQIEPRFNE